MARARSTARPTSRSFYTPQSGDKYLPTHIRELVDSNEPALEQITARVLAARLAGHDVTDEEVFRSCVQDGLLDHALKQLDADAAA